MQSLPDDNTHPEEKNEPVVPETATKRNSSLRKRFGCMGLILVGILICIWLSPTAIDGPSGFLRAHCQNNLHQLGIALHNYHDTYGSFPPAYIADENGKPMHSWRVLILPMLEKEELYEQYRFDEPWDGPNNRKLHDKMPELFQCPSDKHEHGNRFTNYVAVVGKKTAWPHTKPVRLAEIAMKDGNSNTILVVETKNSRIHWMEPRDLEFDKMSFKINDPDKPSISSEHKIFARFHRVSQDDTPLPPHVLTVDGGVRRLFLDISEETLKALLTINGGEKIPSYHD